MDKKEITIQEAMEKLNFELKNDASYYYSWEANISACFKHEYNNWDQNGSIQQISDRAAKRFLKLLTK